MPVFAAPDLRSHINATAVITEYHYGSGQLMLLVDPNKITERFERDAEGRLLRHTVACTDAPAGPTTKPG